MKPLLAFLTYCVLLAAVVALSITSAVLWHLDDAVIELKATVVESRQAIGEVRTYAHNSSQNLNAVLVQWGLASDELRRAAIEQRRSLLKSDRQMQEVMANANQLVRDLDGTINDFNQSRAELTTKAGDAIDEIRPVLQSSERMMDAATSTLQLVGNRVDDPHLQHMVAQMDESAAHVNRSTAIVEEEFEKWTKPVSKVRAVFGTMGQWTLQHLFEHLVP